MYAWSITRQGMEVIIDSESRAYNLKYVTVIPLTGLPSYGGSKYPVIVIRISGCIGVTLE